MEENQLHSEKNIPPKISEYIRSQYDGAFLTSIRKIRRQNSTFYMVDISHDDSIYHLKFDQQGNLLQRIAESSMELDDLEDDIMED